MACAANADLDSGHSNLSRKDTSPTLSSEPSLATQRRPRGFLETVAGLLRKSLSRSREYTSCPESSCGFTVLWKGSLSSRCTKDPENEGRKRTGYPGEGAESMANNTEFMCKLQTWTR